MKKIIINESSRELWDGLTAPFDPTFNPEGRRKVRYKHTEIDSDTVTIVLELIP